jgi:hypothetical protein
MSDPVSRDDPNDRGTHNGAADESVVSQLRSTLQRLPPAAASRMEHTHVLNIREALDSRGDAWAENDLLVLSAPGAEDIVIPVASLPVTLGRGKADIKVQNESVSRPHCRLVRRGALVAIEDLDSKNGTFVNNLQARSQDLCVGDRLALGAVTFAIERR